MKMIELTREKFEDFTKENKYSNYCQTEQYGRAMEYDNFKHIYIGYLTNDDEIVGAAMFLIKKISPTISYAYCPKGFIIDYENIELTKKFVKNIIKYFRRKNIIFLKMNPELPIATIDYQKNYERKLLPTNNILLELKKIGFMRRKEKEPLELIEPKLTAIVNLKEYDYNKLDEFHKRKIEDNNNKGFEIEIANSSKIEVLTKVSNPNLIEYYKSLYKEFKKDTIDLILIKINYEKFLIASKKKIEKEEEKNEELNARLQKNPTDENLNEKMLSDKLLEEYKQEIVYATNGMKKKEDSYVAAALVVKYNNKITLLVANSNKEYEHLQPNYYLYNTIFEMYKDEYEYADLNGIANDFSADSTYAEYNNFKLSFNPVVYEYVGELDIIISKIKYNLNKTNVYYSRTKNKENK